jgi:protein ImuA
MRIFGIEPDKFIFIDTPREKEAFWTIEEALKCDSLCAVIGEVASLDFKESRRLQLAVENSRVTGFINRRFSHQRSSTACVARWQVQPANSRAAIAMPGLAFPRWKVDLLKIRSGRPASCLLEWSGNAFHTVVDENPQKSMLPNLKTGVA